MQKRNLLHAKLGVYLLILVFVFIPLACSPETDSDKLMQEAAEPEEGIAISYHLPLQPLDLVLVIDQSSSMSGYGRFPATDPEELRVTASHYLVSNIAAKKTPESIPRIGVVHFGTDAPHDLSVLLTEMKSEQDVQAVNKGIEPLDLVWTNFIAAFQEAMNLFIEAKTFEKDRKAVIVLLTDGEPSDPRNLSTEDYFSEIEELLDPTFTRKDIDLFIVGIDAADMSWSDHHTRWQELLPTDDSALFHLDSMGDLARVYNDIVRIRYDIPNVPPVIISETETLEFEIPAYLEWVEFHVFSETPEINLNITRPYESIISEEDPNVIIDHGNNFSIIKIVAPEPGTWQYQIKEGRGTVEVYRNMVPVKLRLLQPPAQMIWGTEQEVAVEFSRLDDSPVEIHPDYPIQIDIIVEDPLLNREHYIMEQDDTGFYRLEKLFSPGEEGYYKFIMEVESPGSFAYTDEFMVNVLKLPYVSPVFPKPGESVRASSNLEIEIDLLAGFEPLNYQDYFTTRETALVIAWYKPEGEQESPAYYLHPTGEMSRLAGVLPYEVPQGQHQIRYRVVGELREGDPYVGEDLVVEFQGEIPRWILLRPWAAGIIVLFGVALSISYARRPSWSGMLEIQNTANPEEVIDPIVLERFGKKKQLIIASNGHIPLETPDYTEIRGKIIQVKKEISDFDEDSPTWILQIHYRTHGNEPEMVATLINHNDRVQIGPFSITYLEH